MEGVRQVFTYKETSVRSADGHPCVAVQLEKDSSVSTDIEKGTILTYGSGSTLMVYESIGEPAMVAEYHIPKEASHGTAIVHGSINKQTLKHNGADPSEAVVKKLMLAGIYAS